MRLERSSLRPELAASGSTIWLASNDTLLSLDVERILLGMGFRVEKTSDGLAVLAALETLEESALILLDVRLECVPRLLAAIHDSGAQNRCAIALIAAQVSDEWIQRLREGMIDDIVPRNADAAAWNKHISAMRRGHRLLCELEQLRAAVVTEIHHDRLTGAFNRDSMLRLLFRETDRVQRLRGALSIMIFDIDDFADWNAELGRKACDELLCEVNLRTGRLLRSYDLLGRGGADEFWLALPGCSQVGASLLAERLRMEVFGDLFLVHTETNEKLQVRLTASFGIAASRGRSPVVVLREAEHALNLARRTGPDSIRCAGETQDRAAAVMVENRMLA